MIEFTALWLPIVVSTLAVFFVSFVMWMVLPHHRSDYRRLPDEDVLMQSLRSSGTTGAGQYMFPHCAGPQQRKDAEWLAKYEKGPNGMLVLRSPGRDNTAVMMLVSALYNGVVIALVACLLTMVMPRIVDGGLVFRFVSVAAFLGFAGALGWQPVWFGKTWSSTFKEVFDGAVYGVVTGGVFMTLWPGVT